MTPQRGGELIFVVSAEPDTYDGHKSTTFANIHPIAPHYNTLLKFDPDSFPQMKIVGDLAESWTISPDGLTMHLQGPRRRQVPRRLGVQLEGRQGDLRPDHQAAGGRGQRA